MLAIAEIVKVGLIGYTLACILGVLLALWKKQRLLNYSVHAITAASSLAIALAAIYAVARAYTDTVIIKLPGPLEFLPPLYIVMDPLSMFMAFVISIVAFYASIFAIGYVDEYYGFPGKLGLLGLCLPSFIASMIMVALAGDVVSFLVFWEIMSVTSFFLVLTEFEKADVRKASITYMIYAAFSAICLLVAFALGYAFTESHVFSSWRAAQLTASQASLIFFLALLGFSAKAGVVPFHNWLPRAHPAAPSHVSALLSGVMVKLAMYGIIRVALDALAPWASSSWGLAILMLGAVSTFYGVALAIVQHDIKRLLAYHTIENIGIIMLGIGIAVSAYVAGNAALAVLGIVAGLFHIMNHALFKSLLFLCSGALLHQVHTRDIEEMGGLYKRMKATAIAFLIGSLGITAIPLFNGFASEWCAYSSLMYGMTGIGDITIRFASMISILSLAAAGVLAVYCFTKVFGLVFLDIPRSEKAKHAKEEPASMKASYVLPSLLIVLLGIVPGVAVTLLSGVATSLTGAKVAPTEVPMLGVLVTLWETPSAYIPLLIAAIMGIVAIVAWTLFMSRARYSTVTEPFVSGAEYEESMSPTAMLYVGTLKEVMSKLYGYQREYKRVYAVKYWTSKSIEVVEKPHALLAKLIRAAKSIAPGITKLPEKVDDIFYAVFQILSSIFHRLAYLATRLQCGKLHVYLFYIYATFTALLVYYIIMD